MTYDALLAVSLGVNIGLTVVVVAMAIVAVVQMTMRRAERSEVDEMRQAAAAIEARADHLAERLEVAISEIERLTAIVRERGDA